ncbi:hypothetical protein [Aquisalibacillus elongatus]|uniref:Permuted papain-like amidase YaeF/Yiix C92 family enzyme n=1 Tax=Aquisalibacillus elongatus TaxID=485577 RepID=A0A3N5BMW6_9BACI|nr:hypothetical protein [Aquisalibacillus elongatus]RPF51038.1 hypothetical protein EDC24_2300 [Aquisalibacillus elongatus]
MGRSIVTGTTTNDTVSVHIDLFRYPVRYVKVYLGGEEVGTFHPISDFHLRNPKGLPVKVVLVFSDGDKHETILMGGRIQRYFNRVDYQPGDILVACDNFGDFPPPGYMGHSAIVLDQRSIAEATTSMPQIRVATIREFIDLHPKYMHLRCKNRQAAENARDFAYEYLQMYHDGLQNGDEVPEFSLTPLISLDDPYNSIYCSKLVWLCYYYGANINLENDYFLYSPEDLSTLENDDRFEVLYKHPEFDFKLNS